MNTKLLLSLCLSFALCVPIGLADEVVRDANGKIVATITETPTGCVVRDANGKIIASYGSGTVTTTLPTPTPPRK